MPKSLQFMGGRRLVTLFLILTILSVPLFSQATSARLEGTVKDPTGAVIPKAKVIAVETKTGAKREAIANEAGNFQFAAIAPGLYTMTVEAAGFVKTVVSNVEVTVGGVINQAVSMKIGAGNEVVNVEANAVTVQSTDSTISRAITLKEIDTLPQLARQPIQLAYLQPGVQLNPGDPSFSRINGARQGSNNSRLDGIDINDSVVPRLGLAMTANNTDSIGEFRIVTEGGKAEYGRNAGGTVDLVTRSGSNKFHGNAFDYLRNTALNANEYFNKQSQLATGKPNVRPKYIQNQYGGSFGGPIMKDKWFIFGNYQGRQTKQETVRNRTVLTAAAKQGIFTYLVGGAPTTFNIGANDPRGLGVNATMKSFFNMMPDPNNNDVGDTRNTAGFRYAAPANSLEDQFTIKGDYNVNSKIKTFLRWSWQRNSSIDALNNAEAPYPGGIDGTQGGHRWGYSIGMDWTISNTLVNEFRFGHQSATANFNRPARPQGLAVISNLYTDPISTAYAQGRVSPVNQISDNMTWVKGKHAFRWGTDIRYVKQIGFNDGGVWYNASLTTGSNNGVPSTFGPAGLSSSDRSTFNGLVNDVLGRVGTVAHTFYSNDLSTFLPAGESKVRTHHLNESGWFFQDDWKVNPRLTLNLGLRYEIFGNPWEEDGAQATLDQASAVNGVNKLTNLVITKGRFYKTDRNNLAPRIGFGWDVFGNGKTALRGNWGVFYDRSVGATVNTADGNTPGFATGTTLIVNSAANANSLTTDVRLSDTVPLPVAPASVVTTLPVTNRPTSMVLFNPNLRTGYVQQFALNLQHEIMKNTVVDVGYVGNRGIKLYMNQDFNQMRIDEGFVSAFTQLQSYLAACTNATTCAAAVPPSNVLATMFTGQCATLTTAQLSNLPNNGASCAIARLGSANFGSAFSVAAAANNLDQSFNNLYAVAGLPQTYLRNYPQFNQLIVGTNSGRSSYDSLQASVRRNAGGLQVVANYTYSHSIDNISVEGNGFTSAVDNYNTALNRGNSDADHRHSFNGSVIYALPFGQGKRWANSNKALDYLVGGWEIGSLIQRQDGTVFTISSQRAVRHTSGTGGTTFANFTGDPHLGKIRYDVNGGITYFQTGDAALFSVPTPGSYGTTGRNFFRGPGYFNVDMSLKKVIKVPGLEGHTITFRTEAYNVLNNVNFSNPATGFLTLSSFGRVSSTISRGATDPGSRTLQLALRYDF